MTVSASGDWTGRLYPDRLPRAGGGLGAARRRAVRQLAGTRRCRSRLREPPWRGRDGSLSRA